MFLCMYVCVSAQKGKKMNVTVCVHLFISNTGLAFLLETTAFYLESPALLY